jgi:Tfp pilus assembly protein PilF
VALERLDLATARCGRVLDAPTDVRARPRGAIADARPARRGRDDPPAAAALAPEDGRTLTDAGVVAWRQGDGDGARRLLLRAIDADPVHAVAPTLALGFVYEDAGRQEEARDTYAQALVLEPGHAEALYRLGRRQRQDGDPAAATATLRQALALSGPETLLLLELSRAALDLEHWDDAQRYAREADARARQPRGAVDAGPPRSTRATCWAASRARLRRPRRPARGAHVALAVARYRRARRRTLVAFRRGYQAHAGHPDDPQVLYATAEAAAIRTTSASASGSTAGRTTPARLDQHVRDGSPKVFLDNGTVRIVGRIERPRPDELPGITFMTGAPSSVRRADRAGGAATRTGLSLTYSQVKGAQGKLPAAPPRSASTSMARSASRSGQLTRRCSPTKDGRRSRRAASRCWIEVPDDVSGRFAFSVDGGVARRVQVAAQLCNPSTFRLPRRRPAARTPPSASCA